MPDILQLQAVLGANDAEYQRVMERAIATAQRFGKEAAAAGAAAGSAIAPGKRAVDDFTKSVTASTTVLQRFGGVLQQHSTAMLQVGAALTAGFVASERAAASFQRQMELSHTQAGATQEQVDKLSKAVLGMASSVGTGPEELAKSLYHIVSVGVPAAQQMDVLRVAAEGAKVGMASTEETTNALAATMVSGIKGITGASQAMGVLNATIGSGNMRMGDLNAALSTGLLAKARNFGLTIQDVGAAIATLTDAGMKAQPAAMRLGMSFSLLGAPSEKAAKALASIGLTSTALAKDMRKPEGLLVAMNDLSVHLAESGISAVDASKVIAEAFGGGRSSAAIETLLQNLGRLNTKEEQIRKNSGEFGKEWEATQKEAAFQTDRFTASVKTLEIEAGERLLPQATALVNKLTTLTEGFNHLSSGTQDAIVKTAEAGAALIVLGGVTGKVVGFLAGVKEAWVTLAGTAEVQAAAASTAATGMADATEAAALKTTAATAGMADSVTLGAVKMETAFTSVGASIAALPTILKSSALAWGTTLTQMGGAAAGFASQLSNLPMFRLPGGGGAAIPDLINKMQQPGQGLIDQVQQNLDWVLKRGQYAPSGAKFNTMASWTSGHPATDNAAASYFASQTKNGKMSADAAYLWQGIGNATNKDMPNVKEYEDDMREAARRFWSAQAKMLASTTHAGAAIAAGLPDYEKIKTPVGLASCAFMASEYMQAHGLNVPTIGNAAQLTAWLRKHGANQVINNRNIHAGDFFDEPGRGASGHHVGFYMGNGQVMDSSGNGPGHQRLRPLTSFDLNRGRFYSLPDSLMGPQGKLPVSPYDPSADAAAEKRQKAIDDSMDAIFKATHNAYDIAIKDAQDHYKEQIDAGVPKGIALRERNLADKKAMDDRNKAVSDMLDKVAGTQDKFAKQIHEIWSTYAEDVNQRGIPNAIAAHARDVQLQAVHHERATGIIKSTSEQRTKDLDEAAKKWKELADAIYKYQPQPPDPFVLRNALGIPTPVGLSPDMGSRSLWGKGSGTATFDESGHMTSTGGMSVAQIAALPGVSSMVFVGMGGGGDITTVIPTMNFKGSGGALDLHPSQFGGAGGNPFASPAAAGGINPAQAAGTGMDYGIEAAFTGSASQQQRDKVKQQLDQLWTNSAQSMEQIFTASFDGLFQHGAKGFFSNFLSGFDQMLQEMAAKWMAAQTIMAIGSAIGGPAGQSIGSFGKSILSGLGMGGGRAAGGPVDAGQSYLVGERGPELLVMGGNSGHVIPNSAMGGSPYGQQTVHQTITNHFVVNAPDPGSFRQSRAQIETEYARSASRQAQRNH